MRTSTVIKNIMRIYDNLSENKSRNVRMLQRNMLSLEELLLNRKFNPSEENKIINFLKRKRVLSKLQHFHEIYEIHLEIDFAKKILEGKIKNFKKYPFYKRFLPHIKNDVIRAKISKNDYVLFIGSGPFPLTAIILNKLTGCSVDCYEKNKRSVFISRKVISKLRLSKKIKVYNKAGERFSGNSYSVVLIALLAKPKDKILKRVWNKTSPDTRIICRTASGISQIFYRETSSSLLEYYKPVSKISTRGFYISAF